MTSLENIFEIGLEKEKKYDDKDGEEIFLSVIYANNDQIYMGAYNNSTFGKERKIIECAGNVEECLEELFKKVNNNYNDLKLNNLKKVIVVYDKDTKQQGKEVIKTIKEVIENKYFGVSVNFKEVVLDNSGFYNRVRDINSGKYVLEDDDIIEEYEIMPNYLKKSQAKRLLENKMKNLKDQNVTIGTKSLKNLVNRFWYVYNIYEKIYTNDKRKKMQNKYELKITDLKATYNKNEIEYNGEAYVKDTTDLIFGQERGISAFMFGLDIEKKGYNIYIEGPTGVRKNEIY